MHLQGAVGLALDQDVQVVHPRVDGLEMTATDQHELVTTRLAEFSEVRSGALAAGDEVIVGYRR